MKVTYIKFPFNFISQNKRIECITELMDLCQTMPLATISDIRVKFEGGKQELCPKS